MDRTRHYVFFFLLYLIEDIWRVWPTQRSLKSRAVWRRSKWLNRSRIDHGESKAWRAAIFKVYVTAYRRTGKRVSRNKEGNCRFTSIALISRQTRTVNDTRRSLTRVHAEFFCVPSMCKYIYVYVYVYTCAWFFFLFETVFRDLSSQTVDSIKGNWSSLLTIDGRFCHQLISRNGECEIVFLASATYTSLYRK